MLYGVSLTKDAERDLEEIYLYKATDIDELPNPARCQLWGKHVMRPQLVV
jgi:hypothetical protein